MPVRFLWGVASLVILVGGLVGCGSSKAFYELRDAQGFVYYTQAEPKAKAGGFEILCFGRGQTLVVNEVAESRPISESAFLMGKGQAKDFRKAQGEALLEANRYANELARLDGRRFHPTMKLGMWEEIGYHGRAWDEVHATFGADRLPTALSYPAGGVEGGTGIGGDVVLVDGKGKFSQDTAGDGETGGEEVALEEALGEPAATVATSAAVATEQPVVDEAASLSSAPSPVGSVAAELSSWWSSMTSGDPRSQASELTNSSTLGRITSVFRSDRFRSAAREGLDFWDLYQRYRQADRARKLGKRLVDSTDATVDATADAVGSATGE